MAVIACLVMAGLRVLSSVAFLATGSSHKPVAGNATGPMNADYQARENDAYSIGVQAYIYGLAPVIMERTEQLFTMTPGAGHAPLNSFGHINRLATPGETAVVSPNSDTLYSIGDRTPGLKYNPDGSLDIYIQHSVPAGRESNWLPAPGGDFYVILRMYQPEPQVLNGTYQIPPIQKAA